ncbi:RloB family protein [Virgibacillus halodenitrificans]|uniref:RloB family protein n=1 Tax=Virgibacillus halodenitrificans TaxID=1482 RepID=UPI001FB45BA3|nr:RloB family protein [Virgibacillus halodenitrificans]MCJ0932942.1 RloB family protein [Virgibacillus halodenitrificans]
MAYPSRRTKNKKINKDIYIFCEGTETEKNYFNALKQLIKLPTLKVKVKGTGQSNKKLLDYAVNHTKSKNNINSIWIVYDKDHIHIQEIKHTFKLANKKGIEVAFSNFSFEIWLLLHYEKIDPFHNYDKNIVYKKLQQYLGLKDAYEKHKSDVMMLTSIAKNYKTAIKNNLELIEKGSSSEKSPYTNVMNLVEHMSS